MGFTIKLANEYGAHGVRTITQMEGRGGSSDKIIVTLRRLPGGVNGFSTNDRWERVAEVRTEDLAGFDQALLQLRDIEGITSSETSLLLAQHN